MLRILPVCAALVLALGQWAIWFYAPVEATMGLVQKIFYFHLPLAWSGLLSFTVVFGASAAYLFRRDPFMDLLAGAAAEVGVVLCGLALVTGSIWGRAAWGMWWYWDPKLTTTLIMWFVYSAYLLLRSSGIGGERRSLICAVLGVVAYLDVPLVFIAARKWQVLHPVVLGKEGGGLEPEMWHTVLINFVGLALLWSFLTMIRTRQLNQARRLDSLAMRQED